MKTFLVFILLALAGCVSSMVVPIGQDTYLLTRSVKGSNAAAVREGAVEEATNYCNTKGMSVEILGTAEKGMVLFTSDPEAQVSFKCKTKN